MKTDLTQQRRLAAQALAEEAVEYAGRNYIPRGVVEERLKLYGNPVGQILSEYLRGESAPSLAGIRSLEDRLARLVGRHARKIEVAEYDPYYQQFYQSFWDAENQVSITQYPSDAPIIQLKKLADAVPSVYSRKLLAAMQDPDMGFVQITADGRPLVPRFDPPGGKWAASRRTKKLREPQRQGVEDWATAEFIDSPMESENGSSRARHVFSKEFKIEAVKQVRKQGIPAAQVARDLDVHESDLRKWMRYQEYNPT
jgi:Transposase